MHHEMKYTFLYGVELLNENLNLYIFFLVRKACRNFVLCACNIFLMFDSNKIFIENIALRRYYLENKHNVWKLNAAVWIQKLIFL